MFLYWVAQTTIFTALMVPVVLCLCRAFRDRPSVQHALWVIVLIKFVTPPFVLLPVTLPGAVSQWAQPTDSPAPGGGGEFDSTPMEVDEAAFIQANALANSIDSPFGPDDLPEAAAASGVDAHASFIVGGDSSELPGWRPGLMSTLILTWLVGAVCIAARRISLIRRQAQLLRGCAPAPRGLQSCVAEVAQRMELRPLPTLVATGIASPFVWCLGKLRLVWPRQLADGACDRASRIIIAHELSHVRRRDHWVAWLEMAASLVWWWNPLFWIVRNQVRTTAELACDALALAAYPEERSLYAETLFALSVSKTGVPAPGLAVGAGTPSSLERRLTMMMSEHASGKLSPRGILAAAILALAAFPMLSVAQEKEEAKRGTATITTGDNLVDVEIEFIDEDSPPVARIKSRRVVLEDEEQSSDPKARPEGPAKVKVRDGERDGASPEQRAELKNILRALSERLKAESEADEPNLEVIRALHRELEHYVADANVKHFIIHDFPGQDDWQTVEDEFKVRRKPGTEAEVMEAAPKTMRWKFDSGEMAPEDAEKLRRDMERRHEVVQTMKAARVQELEAVSRKLEAAVEAGEMTREAAARSLAEVKEHLAQEAPEGDEAGFVDAFVVRKRLPEPVHDDDRFNRLMQLVEKQAADLEKLQKRVEQLAEPTERRESKPEPQKF